jgi:hypothetical protein
MSPSGSSSRLTPVRQRSTLPVDTPAFDVTALITDIIRPNADVRTVGTDAELHLSR